MFFTMYGHLLGLMFCCLLVSSTSGGLVWESCNTSETKNAVVLKLVGDVYPTGQYYTEVMIGRPPQPYFLDPDTGSNQTWVQCDAPCINCLPQPNKQYRPSTYPVLPEKCGYEAKYADGLISCGSLVDDVFYLDLASETQISPILEFGCGYDQSSSESYHPIDGMLGLGKGSTVISQLYGQGLIRQVVGHCLSAQGGGYLFLGENHYTPSELSWTSMSNHNTVYSAWALELLFGGETTGIINIHVAFDSGATLSYLYEDTYEKVISLVLKELQSSPLQEVDDDDGFPLCWKGEKEFQSISDVSGYFKTLALRFDGGREESQFEMSPESYLIITSQGNVCMGILNGADYEASQNIIGDISMQGKMVVYDNERKQIGWMSADCDHLPKSNSEISQL